MNDSKITKLQWLTVISSTLISVQILAAPRLIISLAEQDAWIAFLISGLLVILTVLSYLAVSLRFPDLNVNQYIQVIFGKVLGGIFIWIGLIYFILSMGFTTRLFADSIKTFLLDKTPLTVIVLSFLLVAMYLVNKGLLTMVKVIDVIFPIMILGITLIILLPLKQGHFGHLQPILPEGVGRVAKVIPIALQSFQGFGLIGFLMPLSKDKKVHGYLIGGVMLAIILQTLLTITLTVFFGNEEIKHIIYPVISMAKGLEFPGALIERAETLFMLAWIPISFNSIVAHFFLINSGIAHFFPGFKWSGISWLVLALVLFVSIIPGNVLDTVKYILYDKYAGNGLYFVFIPIMLLVAVLRGVKSK